MLWNSVQISNECIIGPQVLENEYVTGESYQNILIRYAFPCFNGAHTHYPNRATTYLINKRPKAGLGGWTICLAPTFPGSAPLRISVGPYHIKDICYIHRLYKTALKEIMDWNTANKSSNFWIMCAIIQNGALESSGRWRWSHREHYGLVKTLFPTHLFDINNARCTLKHQAVQASTFCAVSDQPVDKRHLSFFSTLIAAHGNLCALSWTRVNLVLTVAWCIANALHVWQVFHNTLDK